MKMRIFIILFMVCFMIPQTHYGGSYLDLKGSTTIKVAQAPLRSDSPDGRILEVIGRGVNITVVGELSDRTGTWLDVKFEKNGRIYQGFIDARFTTYYNDFKSGKVRGFTQEDFVNSLQIN